MLHRTSVLVVVLAGSCALQACTEPPAPVAAQVTAPTAPAPVVPAPAAPAPVVPAPAPKPPVAVGERAYVFNENAGSLSFVARKVSLKHDGAFKAFAGTIIVGKDAASSRVEVVIQTASVFTDSPKLTKHLLSPDFLDTATFPTATFVSTAVAPSADAKGFTVTGNFTLHGVTKTLSFPADIVVVPDPECIDAVSVKANFSFNRKDYGIVYPGKVDDLVHDMVDIALDIRTARAPD